MGTTSRSLVELIELAVQRHGGASGRRLAEIAQRGGHEVSHATLNRLRQGTYASRPSDASIRAIAYLAEVPETAAFTAAGVRPPAAEQYQVPAEAHRMSTRQRRALDELLRAFISEELVPQSTPKRGFGTLLAARDRLAAAVADTAVAHEAELTGAALGVIAAIDEAVAALFTPAADDDVAVTAGAPWPPTDNAEAAICNTP
ncbi:Uncharacterised protein [Mycolicibacterium phlei]|uniref:hypothetical protein n=1 Tax=Mycobacteroides chelonae TaxID=1774 RepID=UPI000618ACED|nr:hypothetical protein [Mycobacteroides chelonae]VEG15106.1 Uncharacterised protein [Mycolicibacterium phlei]AKC37997.1 hypothetical protein GR01_04630 [Mycobacteroides chelonae]ANA97135.1 hypothetical protein BB28_04715 [Mycobacteroides chelonae CCUG 47445]OLT80800.1 hypothetical protein BKG56_00350 [Mycobacteroides chelonae]ORV16826.1 hypothetical protein AWB96_00635 [Mycobacteroides chelonae]